MRCELCNRSDTYVYVDGDGNLHDYCYFCIDEIEATLDGYEEDDTSEWWPEEFPEEEFEEESFEGNQGVEDDAPD